jgi:peptide/nickel transport system ATP-binding protein
MAEHLLEVRDLSVEFHTAAGTVKAVQDVSWHLDRGETLAILGESGSGKSVSASAIMNLIDMPPGRITSGTILFNGRDMLAMSAEERRAINGARIAMIFQDPLAHLNPVYTVGWQITEMMTTHGAPREEARTRALDLMKRVGIPQPELAMNKYPFQFSGGQRQRLMIAMALACKPDILIADEPTTALDVTVQKQILRLIRGMQKAHGTGVIFVTHDLGVVAQICDTVTLLYAGKVIEEGRTADVLEQPRHAYTKALMAAAFNLEAVRSETISQ